MFDTFSKSKYIQSSSLFFVIVFVVKCNRNWSPVTFTSCYLIVKSNNVHSRSNGMHSKWIIMLFIASYSYWESMASLSKSVSLHVMPMGLSAAQMNQVLTVGLNILSVRIYTMLKRESELNSCSLWLNASLDHLMIFALKLSCCNFESIIFKNKIIMHQFKPLFIELLLS